MEFLSNQEVVPTPKAEQFVVAQPSVATIPEATVVAPDPVVITSEPVSLPAEPALSTVVEQPQTTVPDFDVALTTARQNPTDDLLTNLANQLVVEPS